MTLIPEQNGSQLSKHIVNTSWMKENFHTFILFKISLNFVLEIFAKCLYLTSMLVDKSSRHFGQSWRIHELFISYFSMDKIFLDQITH